MANKHWRYIGAEIGGVVAGTWHCAYYAFTGHTPVINDVGSDIANAAYVGYIVGIFAFLTREMFRDSTNHEHKKLRLDSDLEI